MKYKAGDMVVITDDCMYQNCIGKVVFADKEALRVDIAPRWYWGEGDVAEAGYEALVGLKAYPMGTIVRDATGHYWVKISSASWARQDEGGFGTIAVSSNETMVTYDVTRVFLGMYAE